MPTYEYRCDRCGRFEHFQSITADPLKECPTCGGPVQRLISRSVNIVFKGTGWHVTDYRSSSYKAAAEKDGEKSSSSSSEAEPSAVGAEADFD